MSFLTGRTSLTTVNTGDIANDAVTLAKLAAGTDGNLISFDTSGNPVAVATGNDGQVLTSAGAGAVCLFEDAAGGGAWTLIGTVVASNDATIGITGLDSTYDSYAIGLSDIVPVTNSVEAYIRLGDSSGVDSGTNDYDSHSSMNTSDATTYSSAIEATSAFMEITTSTGSGAGQGIGAMFFLHRPGDGTTYPRISGTYSAGNLNGDLRGGHFTGMRNAVITLTQVQFAFSSGNVSTGRLTVWGIAHA